MTYLGGKYRFAKRLAKILGRLGKNGSGRYVEPFVGGGSILAAVAEQEKFKRYEAGDTVLDLILFYRALQVGWKPPQQMTDAQWYGLKEAAPSAMRAFAGFGCSWGGIWFSWPAHNNLGAGTGLVDKCPMVYRSVMRDQPHWKKAFFKHQPYQQWKLNEGDVCYCDIPYHDSRGYEANKGETRNKTSFDTAAFWRWATEQSLRGVRIAVSEASVSPMPSNNWFRVWGISRIMGRAIAFKKNADGTSSKDGGQLVVDQLLVHERFLHLCSSDSTTEILQLDEEEEDTEESIPTVLGSVPTIPEWGGNGIETARIDDSGSDRGTVAGAALDATDDEILPQESNEEERKDTARTLLSCCEQAQRLLEYSSAEGWHLWIMREHDPAAMWEKLAFCCGCGAALPTEEEITTMLVMRGLDDLLQCQKNVVHTPEDALENGQTSSTSPFSSSLDGDVEVDLSTSL